MVLCPVMKGGGGGTSLWVLLECYSVLIRETRSNQGEADGREAVRGILFLLDEILKHLAISSH